MFVIETCLSVFRRNVRFIDFSSIPVSTLISNTFHKVNKFLIELNNDQLIHNYKI